MGQELYEKMSLDILFIGKLFPKCKENEIKNKMKTGMQDAANALQWNIIDGLDANKCGKIKILDYLPVDSYPKGYEESFIKEYVFNHNNEYLSNDKVIASTNFTIIKQFVNYFPLKLEAWKWLKQKSSLEKKIIIYTASNMFLKVAKYIKKKNKKIEICCIIADLPEFSSAKKLYGIKKLYNIFSAKRSESLYKYIDKFVLLTDQMSKKLRITVPYLVIEGMVFNKTIREDATIAEKYINEHYVFYSGTLNYEFGISILLEAFTKIDRPDIKLIICGFGEAEKTIKESKDKRIVFLGKLDRTQVIPLQKNATVLVNPRQDINEFTKYSFPSKTLEYLVSGVPIVAYKLAGIPDEYDEFIEYVPDNSPKSLAESIMKIIDLPPEKRRFIGERAKEFAEKNKNYIAQTKKILNFLES